MPTLAELLLALITDQPLSAEEKRQIALHILCLIRRGRGAHGHSDSGQSDFRDN